MLRQRTAMRSLVKASLAAMIIAGANLAALARADETASNKALVLAAVKAVFIDRDASAVDRYWSPRLPPM
ncbi:hypothetical protein [Nitrospirillum sp. BR 11163]|uniref:hypothetical protein n=1 Tax=Nitrospirillum sp. BR 11163 TaxID=3104323 RepID=UPI002AFEB083|nr:hypothetical protein [Nitrospirillum sp. BR 11163]MEA1672807.1 hypothetical protein [Nitrospirillum sp. BR 11163]